MILEIEDAIRKSYETMGGAGKLKKFRAFRSSLVEVRKRKKRGTF